MGKGDKKNKAAVAAANADQVSSKAAAKLAARLEGGEDLYAQYRGKAASDLQTFFADWAISKLGIEFGSKKEEAAFREGLRVGVAMRIPFQASPENQERQRQAAQLRADTKAEKLAAKGAKAKVKADAKPAKKATKPAAEPTEAATEPAEVEATPAEAPKAAKGSKGAKAAKPEPAPEPTPEPAPEPVAETSKPKPTRPAKAAKATGSKAPF